MHGGSIPGCLWNNISSLTVLHAAGNGFSGSLADVALDSSLQDVDISSNAITGPIPASWQTQGKLLNLVLARNRIRGILRRDFVISDNVIEFDFSVNRLSGTIPKPFYSQKNINILNGNYFQCNDSTIPEYDPKASDYVCGSGGLNNSLLLCAAIFVAATLLFFLSFQLQAFFRFPDLLAADGDVLDLKKLISRGYLQNTCRYLIFLRELSLVCCILCAGYTTIGSAVYFALKQNSSFISHEYQYGWCIS